MPAATSVRKRLSRVIAEGPSAALRSAGFKKQGNSFARASGRCSHVVDVQQSRGNTVERAEFTMNCGIYVLGATTLLADLKEPEFPKVRHACVSVRCGMLAEAHRDIWWEVRAEAASTADVEVAQQMSQMVTGVILPFLERFSDDESVARFLESERDPRDRFIEPRAPALQLAVAALIRSNAGDADACRVLIQRSLEAAKRTPLSETIELFARKYGVG